MKLLVADDHTLFRDALVQYIERSDPLASVVLAKDLYEAMGVMEREGEVFDLVILDLRMPGMKGITGFREMRTKYPKTRVALMSGVAEPDDVTRALENGAVGYFPKTISGKSLMTAIQHVLQGNVFVPKDASNTQYIPSHYDDSDEEDDDDAEITDLDSRSTVIDVSDLRDVNFTPREKEVLGYLVDGVSNKEVARALNLQVVTVKLHVRGICRKLNAKNRTQAALKARALGIRSVVKK